MRVTHKPAPAKCGSYLQLALHQQQQQQTRKNIVPSKISATSAIISKQRKFPASCHLLLPSACSPPPSLHLILLLAQISGSRRGRSCWRQESPHSVAATVSEAAPAAEVEADGEAEAVAGAVCDINWRLSKCLCACQKNAADTTQSRWAY